MRTAGEILDRLVGREDLAPGQRDYLEALVRFVRDFEELNYRGKLQRLTPVEVLKHLMNENRMNTSDLGAVLGSRGLASEVLNGKRGLSKTLIAKLARRFRVDPTLFLGAPEEQE
jgi:HTH-type transcriptional regulator/antitoxin HigA